MKKIMFNDKYGLTDAVLQGRKAMTRRVVNVPEYWHGIWVWGFAFDKQSHSLRLYDADEAPMEDPDTGECAYIKPRYNIGEVVAVAQPYSSFRPLISHNDDYSPSHPGWDNKMFVRPDLMPHQIRITDIKVERLQDISDEDCLKEGIMVDNGRKVVDDNIYVFDVYGKHINRWYFPTPKETFAALIDKVSGRGTWESNPHVFAYTFEKN